MPNPAVAAYRGDATTRQLKWLVVLLIVSNIAVGVFAMYALRRADRRYSDLLDHSVPVLNDLQTLTARAAYVLVATSPQRLSNAGPAGATAAHAAIDAEATLRQRLLSQPWVSDNIPKRAEVKEAGERFAAAARTVLADVEQGDRAKATADREQMLHPQFQRYLDAVTVASDQLETESQRINSAESARNSTISRFVLGAATWPVLAIITLLLITATFVLALMLLFRGREMNDVP